MKSVGLGVIEKELELLCEPTVFSDLGFNHQSNEQIEV
jgi:hypothetical protein